MNYANARKTAAQKLTAGLLSFASTAVEVATTVPGMNAGTGTPVATDVAQQAIAVQASL